MQEYLMLVTMYIQVIEISERVPYFVVHLKINFNKYFWINHLRFQSQIIKRKYGYTSLLETHTLADAGYW